MTMSRTTLTVSNPMTNAANWRITFPIEKAERRDDGLYITGLASGPEIDSEGERMERSLIHKFADQINSGGGLSLDDRLVYRDAHAPDGVLRDLGWVTKAWVTDEGHLGVEVRLDELNPAATYLFRQLDRGKKYGMSVAGKVLDFVDEFVSELGKTVRTYRDVVLTEISNTTRPAWTPSFGSVLSKAIDDAAEAESLAGVNHVDNEELAQETTAEETEKADEQLNDVEFVTDSADTTGEEAEKAEETTESEDEDVEKAGRKFSQAAAAKLLGMYAEIGNTLAELGLIEDTSASNEPAEKADSEDNGADLEKSEDETPSEIAQLRAQNEELVRSITELTAKVQELEKRQPTQLPPVIERADANKEEFEKALSELSPAARLRVAMAAHTGGR